MTNTIKLGVDGDAAYALYGGDLGSGQAHFVDIAGEYKDDPNKVYVSCLAAFYSLREDLHQQGIEIGALNYEWADEAKALMFGPPSQFNFIEIGKIRKINQGKLCNLQKPQSYVKINSVEICKGESMTAYLVVEDNIRIQVELHVDRAGTPRVLVSKKDALIVNCFENVYGEEDE
ncbi:MAG: hypothetical protein WC444_04770 [Candidatus Paceibacterota bacterium]